MKISILSAACPFRPERINSFLASFRDLTTDPSQVEILVKADHDCQATIDTVNSYRDCLNVRPVIMNGDWRRTGLMRYWNGLGAEASGELMWFLNDRAVIATKGWDQLLVPFIDGPIIFYPSMWSGDEAHVTGNCSIIARKWFDVLGYITKHNAADVFMNMVGNRLGPRVRVPGLYVKLEHPRYDYPTPKEQADALRCVPSDPLFQQDVQLTVQKLLEASRMELK